MTRKKTTRKLARLLRKTTGITFVESMRAAKLFMKEGLMNADTGAWPFRVIEDIPCCWCYDGCGRFDWVIVGWKGPKGFLPYHDAAKVVGV